MIPPYRNLRSVQVLEEPVPGSVVVEQHEYGAKGGGDA